MLGASNNTIGPGNLIAFNTNHGVQPASVTSIHNTITQNSIYSNGGEGIRLMYQANEEIAAPYYLLRTATEITGLADAPDGSIVEVFSDQEEEGATFIGQTPVVDGQFVLAAVVDPSLTVTATVTDPVGNTSEFGHSCSGEAGMITDFEEFEVGNNVLFITPHFSWSTREHVLPGSGVSAVTDEYALSGTKSCNVQWEFVDSEPTRWLRLHTDGRPYLSNPTISHSFALRFQLLLTSGSFYLCMATRETGTYACLGDDGGGYFDGAAPIEFVGAESYASGDSVPPLGRLITASPEWQEVTFLIPAEPVLPFAGDGMLNSPNGRGTFEELSITINPSDPNAVGPFSIYIDDVEMVDPGQLDCNGNGIDDSADISGATSSDCNGNGVPDECEWADCNANGIPDDCDLADGTEVDCNGNSRPDSCDLALGSSTDCDENGVPDDCQEDSDDDGVIDVCDVCHDTPLGLPVNDEGRPLGDWDGDCIVGSGDVPVFLTCLDFSGPGNPALFQECRDIFDFDDDEDVDLRDFSSFLMSFGRQ